MYSACASSSWEGIGTGVGSILGKHGAAWSLSKRKQTAGQLHCHCISAVVHLAKDILCVILAFVDLAVTYTTPASQFPGLGRCCGAVSSRTQHAWVPARHLISDSGGDYESQDKPKDASPVSQGLGLRIAGHTEDAVTWLRVRVPKTPIAFCPKPRQDMAGHHSG